MPLMYVRLVCFSARAARYERALRVMLDRTLAMALRAWIR